MREECNRTVRLSERLSVLAKAVIVVRWLLCEFIKFLLKLHYSVVLYVCMCVAGSSQPSGSHDGSSGEQRKRGGSGGAGATENVWGRVKSA